MLKSEVYEVGMISLVQSIIMFTSFTQMGTLNGAYRLVSKSGRYINRINQFIFSYNFHVLMIGLILIYPLSIILNITNQLTVIAYAIIAGVFSIVSNWLSNLLVADQKISKLNLVNIISISCSFLCLLIYNFSSLWSGILLVTSQSFILVITAIYAGNYKVTISKLSKRTFKYIVGVGFLPFLINIIGVFFNLIEKWFIVADLGVNSLGQYYIVGLYSTFFLLIPGALNNLEFPIAVRNLNFELGPIQRLMAYKFYFLKLIFYIIFVGFATYFLMDIIIPYLLPNYVESIYLLKIIFWGLAAVTIVQPITLIIQVNLEYKTMFFIYAISIILTLMLYFINSSNRNNNLIHYAQINLFFNSIVAFFYCSVYFFYVIKNN